MAISPSRERAVPVPVLQEWMKKHKCNLFGMHALPQTPDTKAMNEESFKTLWRLLTEKGIVSLLCLQSCMLTLISGASML